MAKKELTEFDIIKTFLVLQDCPWNKKEIFGKFLF